MKFIIHNSYLLRRFTEELFACLVAFIFIMSAFKNTFSKKKIHSEYLDPINVNLL